jgi:predicted dinucleotide-binding enzyme
VFAGWLDAIEELIRRYSDRLGGKVVIDPSNPITADGKGGFVRTLPDRVSAGRGI